MTDRSFAELSLARASRLLREGNISSVELTEHYLSRIAEKNPTLNAYLEVFEDAKEQALLADKRRARGDGTPLLGIPLAVKDNIVIEGRRAGAASKILEGYIASYDATAITKLKAQGAVFLGRTNMDEFAMGGSNENSAYGAARNPLDPSRVPGGSSGGSAAAVAGDMALAALGSDTGGSVREPAAFCGVVGLKPTYGAVSRYGLIAMGSSLDQIGPLTRTVEDAKILFEAIAGHDPLDSTSLPEGLYSRAARTRRVAVPRALLTEVPHDARATFEKNLAVLASAGYEIIDCELPRARYALPVYYILMPAESSTNLARFDGVRYGLRRAGASGVDEYAATRGEGFGPEVRRRIILGTYVLSAGYYDAYFGKATALRALLTEDYVSVLADADIIATPTTPGPAFRLGEKEDPVSMYLTDIFTVTANLTGMPALSIPAGTVLRDGVELPLGFQATALHGREDILFEVGAALEKGLLP